MNMHSPNIGRVVRAQAGNPMNTVRSKSPSLWSRVPAYGAPLRGRRPGRAGPATLRR
jgi:hypothetical protein